MSMRKKVIADNVIKLLKKGYSPKEVTERMAVSYNYAWKLKKDLENAAKELFTPEEMGVSEEAFVEAALAASQGKGRDKPTPKPEPEVSGVDKVLDTRADQYGSFMHSSDTAIKIKGAMHNAIARNDLHLYPDQLVSLDMIAIKISRIVNGNPAHRDSWLDIAGYAMLVADRLQGKSR